MKRRYKILSWFAVAIVALIALMLIIIATFNWNQLRPYLNNRVSQALGRPFAINGNLTVDWRRDRTNAGGQAWLPWPEFTANNVSIGNPAWATQPKFAQLDALRFRLSPLPLLAHRIVVPSLQLVHPNVDLERDAKNRATWDFTLKQNDQPSTWKLELGSIAFDSGKIALDDAPTRTKLKIIVEPLKSAIPYDQIVAQQSDTAREDAGKTAGASAKKALADHTSSKDPDADKVGQADASTRYLFSWKATGSYRGAPATGHGKTGSVLALQQSNRPFPLQADLHLGDSHIALVGTLTDPLHLGALDVRLWFSGSSMAKLYPIIGITLPDTPPYATEGHLKATLRRAGSEYHYQNFRGRVGASDLAGSLDYVTGTAAGSAASRPKLSGEVTSKQLRFADLAPLIGAGSTASKQQRGDTTTQPADRVLPVEPFRTDRWRVMDADVKFNATQIVHGDTLPISSLNTHLVLNNGRLTLDPLRFGLAGGTAAGSLKLDGSTSPMHGAMKLRARHLKLKQLFPTFAPMQTSFGEINGDAQLSATGNSVAALLGSADGQLKLLMNDGAISKALLETAGLNVGNIILAKLFGDKTVKINCAATDLVAKNGLFDVRLFVFDTGDAVINMDGTINLANEQLNLDVQPHTRGARIFSLRSPLYVKGTLKNPDVGVQKGPLLLRAGGAIALATIAAPAAALLAVVAPSHDNDGDNTCRAVLSQLRHSGTLPNAEKAKAAATKK
ncbi:MAG: AsmA family protein [Rhodanobacter sp.]